MKMNLKIGDKIRLADDFHCTGWAFGLRDVIMTISRVGDHAISVRENDFMYSDEWVVKVEDVFLKDEDFEI